VRHPRAGPKLTSHDQNPRGLTKLQNNGKGGKKGIRRKMGEDKERGAEKWYQGVWVGDFPEKHVLGQEGRSRNGREAKGRERKKHKPKEKGGKKKKERDGMGKKGKLFWY